MKSIKPTHWALIIVSACLIAADIYWATDSTPGNTISEVILLYAKRYTVIPFLFGVMFGHLLWPQFLKKDD